MADRTLPIDGGRKLKLYKDVKWAAYAEDDERTETEDITEAQVVSSEIRDSRYPWEAGHHLVLLDLDVPAHLIPSSTPGHSHLYIEVPVDWPVYERLLEALADAGVIETGYVSASRDRKATHLRLPWIKKEAITP